jgi:hypothetical protein
MEWTGVMLLGAYHGINPGMGWLFAVALGMQQGSARGAPFRYVAETVRPYRARRDNEILNTYWWRLWRSRPSCLHRLGAKRDRL